MRFHWETDPDTKLVSLAWQAGAYDAIVSPDRLIFDRGPNVISPDRTAVASVILLEGFLEGPIDFPSSIAPLTAYAIQRYLQPATVNISAIDPTPRQLPQGANRLIVTQGFASRVEHGLKSNRQMQLVPLRADEHSGALFGIDHLYVISNYYMLAARTKDPSLERLRLALGVLFAEDAFADVLLLHTRTAVRSEWIHRHRELLGAVNLGLELSCVS